MTKGIKNLLKRSKVCIQNFQKKNVKTKLKKNKKIISNYKKLFESTKKRSRELCFSKLILK